MLILYEMANNHGGDVNLGRRIIDEFSAVAKQFPQFRHCFKFQYRSLPHFIHPTADPNNKYVKRFRETNLSTVDRRALQKHADSLDFDTACTPFDEPSVYDVVRDGYDILKVGSPSFSDWLLWDRIFELWRGPIIASCGGATESEIDRVVEQCKGRDLTLMHCVSEYPTKLENYKAGQIDWLRKKYPHIPIGFSSHGLNALGGTLMAAAKGAKVFERHVCLQPVPNTYSITPKDGQDWLLRLTEWTKLWGEDDIRIPGPRPTMFQRRNIDGKMWWKPEDDVVDEIRALIKKSGVVVPKGSTMELYHHRGMENFRKTGATILTCFNRDYCKKLIVLLPGQVLPVHTHKVKEETFHLLYGDVDDMQVGDTLLILPGTAHGLTSRNGAILEEISTRYLEGDSTYTDNAINQNKNRKTKIEL